MSNLSVTSAVDGDSNGRWRLPISVSNGGADIPALLKYFRIAVRWRWVVCGIVVGALLLGLLGTLLMTPKYTASSTIEISRQQDRIVNVADVRPESGAADLEFYQTQYSLLKARTLAERVVDELKIVDNNTFFEMFNVRLENDSFFADQTNSRLTPVQRAERRNKAIDVLLKNSGVDPIRASRLVNVTFTSPDPALSQRIVNAWTKNFIDLTLVRRFDATSYARKFLEDRLVQLRERLETSERQLVAYAQAEKIISIPASGASAGQQADRPLAAEDLASINGALSGATADRIRAESRLRQAGGRGGETPDALQNTTISELRQKRAEVAAEYAKLLIQYEPEYPAARALASQVRNLDGAINREESRVGSSIRVTYNEAVARERGLKERVEELKSNLLDMRRRSIQYNIYQRDVDTNRQLYDGLLQRYKEIGIAGGVGTNNIAIVDTAQLPRRPSSPNLLLNMLIALIAGLAIALVAALALEQIDEGVKDPSEVGDATGLPLLGVIPEVVSGDSGAQLLDRKSPMSEAYISLQTNLQFATDHGVPRSLSVTSTRASEGKSTTSFAIATSLARTGRRVILVDGDMRSPSVHHLVGVTNENGVSNILAGDDNIAALVVPVPAYGLSAMPAGPQPPNAAELLTGLRLKMLIDTLLEQFDHVVIDSPPVLGLADAPLIASRTEGVVYAVQSDGARSSMIRTALSRLAAADANILGVVLTRFEARKAHYGYGYDYGYGYGDTKT